MTENVVFNSIKALVMRIKIGKLQTTMTASRYPVAIENRYVVVQKKYTVIYIGEGKSL